MKLLLSVVILSVFIGASHVEAKANFDVTFNIGPSLSQSGSIEELGDPNLSTGFGFNYYFKTNHGIGLSYNNESSYEGSRKFPDIKEASFSSFDIHYVYRYIKDKFHFVFEPGIGRQTLYDEAYDYYWNYTYSNDISTAFLLNYKLFARYYVADLSSDGSPDGAGFFLGAGVIHNFSYDDSLNGRDISGNRLAGLFQVGLGF